PLHDALPICTALWAPKEALAHSAANPERSVSCLPTVREPVSRDAREQVVVEGTVARAPSRPADDPFLPERPISIRRPFAWMSSASWTATSTLIPSRTTMSGDWSCARGRATLPRRLTDRRWGWESEWALFHRLTADANWASTSARQARTRS